MNTEEIRRAYLKFFEERGHVVVPRARLVPDNDPTTLFTGSGMQPMINYLLGQPHPDGQRIVDSQTCLRAQDIDDIGDNRHTTFFEMLGNWSMGDYFKEQQIKWMYEFLSEIVKLDMSRVYVTCYSGNERLGIAKDTEAGDIWAELFESAGLSTGQADIGTEEAGYQRGMKDGERIFYYDGSKNWWSRNGDENNTPVGDPCGPDTEMFYDFGTKHDSSYGEFCHPNCDCGRFMEIGNNVFMAYKKVDEGRFEELESKNVDHGSGLERISAAKLDDPDVYKISLIWPIIEKLESLSGKKYDSHTESMRVIADHLRASTFLAVDGVTPSNKEQGYVMRRLIRRAMVKAFDLGVEQNFMQEIVPVIADLYADDFPEVKQNRDNIIAILVKEEKAFRATLQKGRVMMLKIAKGKVKGREHYTLSAEGRVTRNAVLRNHTPENRDKIDLLKLRNDDDMVIDGSDLFLLYDTMGFPYEVAVEFAILSGVKIAEDSRTTFEHEMFKQRERSRTATKGTFKGGLGGQDLIHKKYHTATHLMYQALRDVLGNHVVQHGSNITEERLRFDFSHPEKVSREQLDQVEAIVNREISKDLRVTFAEYPTEEATGTLGALGQFGDRYGDIVKVYSMKDPSSPADERPFSFEICGGPHVDHTLVLIDDSKTFKIIKEESSSAGIRRIKAVLT